MTGKQPRADAAGRGAVAQWTKSIDRGSCRWQRRLRTVLQRASGGGGRKPMLAKLDALPQALGGVNTLLADSDHFSEANVAPWGASRIIPRGASVLRRRRRRQEALRLVRQLLLRGLGKILRRVEPHHHGLELQANVCA